VNIIAVEYIGEASLFYNSTSLLESKRTWRFATKSIPTIPINKIPELRARSGENGDAMGETPGSFSRHSAICWKDGAIF